MDIIQVLYFFCFFCALRFSVHPKFHLGQSTLTKCGCGSVLLVLLSVTIIISSEVPSWETDQSSSDQELFLNEE